MNRFLHSLLLILLVLISQTAAAQTLWELTISTNDTMHIESIVRRGAVLRRARQSTEAAVLSYRAEWVSARGDTGPATSVSFFSGKRSVPAQGAGCRVLPADRIVLHVEGPSNLIGMKGLRLRGRALPRGKFSRLTTSQRAVAAAFEKTRFSRIRRDTVAFAAAAAAIGSVQLVHGDGAANRFNLVILSEGYTAAELPKFEDHAKGVLAHLGGHSPWDQILKLSNVYLISVPSAQSGADRADGKSLVDTAFGASFWTAGLERLLALPFEGERAAFRVTDSLLGSGVADQIVVLVNSDKYGGSGGSLVVTSAHKDASHILVHELGHSFAGLADEYSDPYPGMPFSAEEPNVDVDPVNPKWSAWLTHGVSLPTPATLADEATVGAFEGARYHESGVYRPAHNCTMKSLGTGFCPICREAHIKELAKTVSFLRDLSPNGGTKKLSVTGRAALTVTPEEAFADSLTLEWNVCGTLVTGQSTITFQKKQLRKKNCRVTLSATYSNAFVRNGDMTQRFTWNAKPAKKRASSGAKKHQSKRA